MLGIVAAVAVALVLKRTLLRGQTPPFLMELPSYKWPSPRTVAFRVAERGWVFLRTAGTLILAISIVVWAAAYYPARPPAGRAAARPAASRTRAGKLARLGAAIARSEATRRREIVRLRARDRRRAYQRHSLLGRLGRLIEPAVRPLGWDWRIGCAVLASLPAREVVVATLGVVYSLGKDVDPESAEGFGQLQDELRGATWDGTDRPVFTIPVALSIMVFYALCAQCAATLAVIRRETNSWRWPAVHLRLHDRSGLRGGLATYRLGTLLIG